MPTGRLPPLGQKPRTERSCERLVECPQSPLNVCVEWAARGRTARKVAARTVCVECRDTHRELPCVPPSGANVWCRVAKAFAHGTLNACLRAKLWTTRCAWRPCGQRPTTAVCCWHVPFGMPSHGVCVVLYGVDDRYAAIDDLLRPLNNKNCRRLAENPKLMSQTPVSVTPATNNRLLAHEVIKEGTHRDELPLQRRNCDQGTDADFLICCSTTDSRVFWRSNLRGSRFIQAICECFARHSAVDDILRLMTRVNAVVAAMNSNKKVG
ncbi:Ced-3p [Globodera pallida]|nr:Ced-3p [Globodera pallida]